MVLPVVMVRFYIFVGMIRGLLLWYDDGTVADVVEDKREIREQGVWERFLPLKYVYKQRDMPRGASRG